MKAPVVGEGYIRISTPWARDACHPPRPTDEFWSDSDQQWTALSTLMEPEYEFFAPTLVYRRAG